ncbi:hypothetical protein [Roseiflexus castenholzii]|uniref:pPIWI_RE_Z domain-containing protein n=1 Tax=Roseiflexus castenholzii TaxID=120962 RepID=UPI003C7ECD75
MRDIRAWAEPIMKELRKHWPKDATIDPFECCCIEIGLHVTRHVAQELPTRDLWALLMGYPFPGIPTDAESQRMLHVARLLLPFFRSPFPWRRALERYRQIPEHLRGYDVDANGTACRERSPTIASKRQDVYRTTLNQSPPYRCDQRRPAQAGRYSYWDGAFWRDVRLTEDVILPAPPAHPINEARPREPITVTWDDLIATARWMDNESAARGLKAMQWERRIERVRLELVNESDGTLTSSRSLTLNGVVHLIGMVGSGKSTLMDVLAVWMAREGRHTTIIVGDVISVLERADRLARLGLPVAPILGASNRKRHLQRLHRTLAAAQPDETLAHHHTGFTWLSTACPLDGLRDQPNPLDLERSPCWNLRASPETRSEVTCPLYSGCPSHQAQRDAVNALIWIATPASFIYRSIDPQINRERIRFAELTARHSDLLIIDEADRVQMHLDMIFSPNQTLVGPGDDAWLSRLWKHVVQSLNDKGREPLRNEAVSHWVRALETAQTVTDTVYTLLLREPALRTWVGQKDYFTDWLLLDRIAHKISGAAEHERPENPTYERLMRQFEAYLDDPLGERREDRLTRMTTQAILHTDDTRLRGEIGTWIDEQSAVPMDPDRRADVIVFMQFALLVAALQNRIAMLLRLWKQVETELELETLSSMLFHRPPDDYMGVIPVAPMGNVLAFQYGTSSGDPKTAPDLRFLRCMGVGRWLMLHFPSAFADNGVVGPHTLLLSGTSWAIGSHRYHVQARVNGILRAPDAEVQAIERSVFTFQFFCDADYRPIRISGQPLDQRNKALIALLHALVKPGDRNGVSVLEQTRNQLPEGRQKILLLVGSYEEAREAAAYVRRRRPEWNDQVIHLVPDDDEFESQWLTGSSGGGLQRGLVEQFGVGDAWILIAPLLAVERGHNILNERNEAAIGAAYVLVRPHPRPDDITYAIHAINRWALDSSASLHQDDQRLKTHQSSLEAIANAFRRSADKKWRRLLQMPMIYKTLTPEERDALTWTQLVVIWQVIGRLVRGGSPARVFFCDAAFAPRTVDGAHDAPESSLLVSMRSVLRPYFSADDCSVPATDRSLAQALYGPLYTALERMEGVADAALS